MDLGGAQREKSGEGARPLRLLLLLRSRRRAVSSSAAAAAKAARALAAAPRASRRRPRRRPRLGQSPRCVGQRRPRVRRRALEELEGRRAARLGCRGDCPCDRGGCRRGGRACRRRRLGEDGDATVLFLRCSFFSGLHRGVRGERRLVRPFLRGRLLAIRGRGRAGRDRGAGGGRGGRGRARGAALFAVSVMVVVAAAVSIAAVAVVAARASEGESCDGGVSGLP